MTAIWDFTDFDDHEAVQLVHDREAGLSAVIAIHSTHIGPAAGGVRFWHYADKNHAVIDALRLSRGMSYKNAMAGLPLGGGKAVILADADGRKDEALLHSFGRAVEALGGRYITAEDVGINLADMVTISSQTRYVCGLPVDNGAAGGDPAPLTALGVYLGIKAAIAEAFQVDSAKDVRVLVQGVGSVGGHVARKLAAEGAQLVLADANWERAQSLAFELGAKVADPAEILSMEADVLSPNALGAVLNDQSIEKLRVKVVAGAANNQLATAADGAHIHQRGIIFAPDYVINAGGIINVGLEYLGQGSREEVESRIQQIPNRLRQIWAESKASDVPASEVADGMARRVIGRGE